MTQTLRERLLGADVVVEDEWDASSVEGDEQATLAALQRQPFTRGRLAGDDQTALTAWQAGRIGAGDPESLRLGGYLLREPLGEGGMGAVFLAWELRTRRLVALKVLHEQDADASAALGDEAELLANLSHPGLPVIYDHDVACGRAYISMQYVAGLTLRQRYALAEGVEPQRPDIGRLREVVGQIRAVAEALGVAHARGIVHRDVKPDNVMLNADGRTFLLDMGIADLTGQRVTADSAGDRQRLLGTAEYMAPEQWEAAGRVGPPADVYALGLTMYFALVGRPPFGASNLAGLMAAHQSRSPQWPEGFAAALPPTVTMAFERMTARDPGDRFADGAAAAAALAECLDAPAARGGGTRGGAKSGPLARRWPYAAAAALLAVAGLVMAVMLPDGPLASGRNDPSATDPEPVAAAAVPAPVVPDDTVAPATPPFDAEALLKELRTAAPRVWTSTGDLRRIVGTPDPEAVGGVAGYRERTAALAAAFGGPFADALDRAEDPDLRDALHTLHAATVAAAAGGDGAKLEFAGVADGAVAVGETYVVQATAVGGGFPLLVQLADDGELTLVRWTEPLPAGRTTALLPFAGAAPGRSLFLLAVHPADPAADWPAADLTSRPPLRSDQLLSGLLAVTFDPDAAPEDGTDQPPGPVRTMPLDRLRGAFAHPAIHDRILNTLRTGTPYPFAQPPSTAAAVDRQLVTHSAR